MPTRLVLTVVTVAALTSAALGVGVAIEPKFYSDDPILRDPETQNASGVQEIDISEGYDFLENSFFDSGDHTNKRAVNVNTIDEVPDSSWFTNRIGREAWTVDRLVRGPDTSTGPSGTLTIVAGKMEGIAPGFTARDSTGQLYFIKFDPSSNPEMASGAEVISTKLFYAFGYHVPENYLATIRREALDIGEGAPLRDKDGRRMMKPRDLDALLRRTARQADGSYRAIASKALEGKPAGHFRYYGTRPDDPNDIYPHEHRRELRGMAVFAAWLNHDDSRSINNLDTLVRDSNRTVIRHNLLDFGSTLGSGTLQVQSTRAGNEYLWDARPTLITMMTLGLYVRPWIRVSYPDIPAVGRIESTQFDPERWKPEYPNAAFENARPEDRFWAARIVAALPDEAIRPIVDTAKYSDPKATNYLTDTILARKNKVLKVWLNGTNPVVNPQLSPAGELTFENAAQKAGVGPAAERYTIQWSSFDNASSTHKDVGSEQLATSLKAQVPPDLLSARPEYVAALVRAFHADHPAWSQPLMLYFRRAGESWSLVGLERNP
ncbi:MAG TPA: hypothetical protein VIZ32_01380 [Vicinamibacterales bacterium]